MPIYEYRCAKCSHQYDKRESFDAPAKQRCPKCGGSARRVIQAPPVVFKGSGFYVTDSRKSSHDSGSEAAADTTTKDAKKDSASPAAETSAAS